MKTYASKTNNSFYPNTRQRNIVHTHRRSISQDRSAATQTEKITVAGEDSITQLLTVFRGTIVTHTDPVYWLGTASSAK